MTIYQRLALDHLMYARTAYADYQRQMWERLRSIASFEELFVLLTGYLPAAHRSEARAILFLLNRFRGRFQDQAVDGLIDLCAPYALIPVQERRRMTEPEYRRHIVRSFADYFPGYRYVGQEVQADGRRIDILAEQSDIGRKAVIELKTRDVDPCPQLQEYAAQFDDPVLIGVTELPPVRPASDRRITVLQYRDLNQRAACRIKRHVPYSEGEHRDGSYIYYTLDSAEIESFYR